MAVSKQYLAIDLGAESGRAMLGAFDGERLELTEVHRFPNGPVRLADGLHWDVLRLWSEIQTGICLAASRAGDGLRSLGLDTWGVDFALLDRQGGLLGNPFHYRDSRTDGMLEEAFRRLPKERIFEATGIQFMQINTIFQLLSMVVNGSPLLEAASAPEAPGTLLTMPDLFNYWLSGQAVSEFTIATTTQCFDPRRREWATPVLEALGIPVQIFPRVVPPGTVLGDLQPYLRADLGLPAIPVVAPACHDTGSAVTAVPAEGERFAWISSGTWSIVGTEAAEPAISPATLESNFTNEGGTAGWRLSKNVVGLWLVQECKRTWARQGEDLSYDDLTRLAAGAQPFLAFVDTDSPDFLKPGDMPGRIQAYCRRTGQAVPETKGAVIRCILESIALRYRLVLEGLEQVAGGGLEPIHIIGGGTKNRLLSQLAADATGRVCVTGPIEATTIGNCLMQAVALGDLGSIQEARQLVRQSFTPQVFEPQARAGWDETYEKFLTHLDLSQVMG